VWTVRSRRATVFNAMIFALGQQDAAMPAIQQRRGRGFASLND